jgi:hypothetical protein
MICGSHLPAPGKIIYSAGVNNAVLSQIPQRTEHLIEEQAISGAVTLAAYGHALIEFNGLGMADIETGCHMQEDTTFPINFTPKPVTATGIMMLPGNSKLALPDPGEQIAMVTHYEVTALV